MSTENRRPHTVYLSDEVWDALERRHLQLRLDSPLSVSKIDFVEQVLRAGLDALAIPSRPQPVSPPPAPAADVEIPDAAVTGNGAAPENQEQRRSRRPSAVDRLRQASEPGRPAPIRSAADGPDTTT